MPGTRAEHMRWCKDRAKQEYEYYKKTSPGEAISNAVASMLSDLDKHPDTQGLRPIAVMAALTVRDGPSLMRFIDGFAE